MNNMFAYAILVILAGFVVLVFGNRMVIFASGVGALLGIGILRFFPGSQESWLWLLIPVVLAVLFAIGAVSAKAIISLISMALGALAGGGIVLAVLDLFGFDLGVLAWIFVLAGAVVGAGLLGRFKDWTLIVLTSLVGALLAVRGLQMLLPFVQGFLASLISLVLTAGGIAYHAGLLGAGKRPR